MPPLLEPVARTCSPEIFLLTVMAICFGTAWLTSLAGVSLSLGAFLAGLVVSESRFTEHAPSARSCRSRSSSRALFFVSVGMLLDLRFMIANLPLVLAAGRRRAGDQDRDHRHRGGDPRARPAGGLRQPDARPGRRVLLRPRARRPRRRPHPGGPRRGRLADLHRRHRAADGGDPAADRPRRSPRRPLALGAAAARRRRGSRRGSTWRRPPPPCRGSRATSSWPGTATRRAGWCASSPAPACRSWSPR